MIASTSSGEAMLTSGTVSLTATNGWMRVRDPIVEKRSSPPSWITEVGSVQPLLGLTNRRARDPGRCVPATTRERHLVSVMAQGWSSSGQENVRSATILIQDAQHGGVEGCGGHRPDRDRVSPIPKPPDDMVKRRRQLGTAEPAPGRRATDRSLRGTRDDLGSTSPGRRCKEIAQEPPTSCSAR